MESKEVNNGFEPIEIIPEDIEKKPKRRRKKEAEAKPRKEPLKLSPVGGVIMLAIVMALSAAGIVVFLKNNGQADFRMVGALIVFVMSFVSFAAYLLIRFSQLASSFKQMIFISVLITFAEILSLVTMSINHALTPALLAVLLIALMTNEKAAMLASLPLAATAGIAANALGETDSGPWAIVMAILISSLCAVYALNMRKTRSTTVVAAAIAAIAGAMTYIGVMLCGGEPFSAYWINVFWLLGGNLICGVLTVGFMPVCEVIFDIASDARLNELLNNDNPMLKRLMTEAPGTYHHSLLVASLAEAAADEVGANALLCRVSAYYHDVGKLRCPSCFKENQRPGYNIHDELDPYESAKRIISHQQDGVTLLEKAKFPAEVINIVGCHHGDSVMVYFYDKARKMAPEGAEIDENKFRYPSKKPETKEAAILMLADCCEAAVRSMPNPSMDDIEAKVRDVITHKWDKRNSMLWASPLTFAEIRRIEDSFISTFAALHHERVEYPDLEDIDVR